MHTILRLFALTVMVVAASGCDDMQNRLPNSDLFGFVRFVVSAEIDNQSAEPVKVIIGNGGPHGGACDLKNAVSFVVDRQTKQLISETWRCKMEQNFSITVLDRNFDIPVEANNPSRIVCDDEECVLQSQP